MLWRRILDCEDGIPSINSGSGRFPICRTAGYDADARRWRLPEPGTRQRRALERRWNLLAGFFHELGFGVVRLVPLDERFGVVNFRICISASVLERALNQLPELAPPKWKAEFRRRMRSAQNESSPRP